MKHIWLFLILAGCSNVAPPEWEAAIKACEQYKGLKHIHVSGSDKYYEAHCNNDTVIKGKTE